MSEFEFEPIRGLPAHLPAGERILWQGAPSWRSLAIRAFHIRKVAVYFGLLALWRAVSAMHDGASFAAAATSALWLALLALVALGLLAFLAWVIGRTTVYTVTTRRLVMRFCAALPMSINIPFSRIESAALGAYGDGSGDIPLTLVAEDRLSYLIMWPHVRPWRITRPRAMLRGVPDAAAVAECLSDALAAAADPPKRQVAQAARTARWSDADAPPLVSAVS